MRPRLPPFLFLVEKSIRHGNVRLARRELRRLATRRVRREHLALAASLARRANLPDLSVQLLHPVVRPRRPLEVPASDSELAEYAIALVKLGATEEGEALLQKVKERRLPEALFFKVAALVSQWRYAETIPLLKEYLAVTVDPYQRLVGEVNLAAAYIHERRHREVDEIIGKLLERTRQEKLFLLHGNALELAAQNALLQSQWDRADGWLSGARAALVPSGSRYSIVFATSRSGTKL